MEIKSQNLGLLFPRSIMVDLLYRMLEDGSFTVTSVPPNTLLDSFLNLTDGFLAALRHYDQIMDAIEMSQVDKSPHEPIHLNVFSVQCYPGKVVVSDTLAGQFDDVDFSFEIESHDFMSAITRYREIYRQFSSGESD